MTKRRAHGTNTAPANCFANAALAAENVMRMLGAGNRQMRSRDALLDCANLCSVRNFTRSDVLFRQNWRWSLD
jgi:hypothetical protein